MNRLLVIAHRDTERSIAIDKALELAEVLEASVHIMAFCHQELDDINSLASGYIEQVKQRLIDKKHQWLEDLLVTKNTEHTKVTFDVVWHKNIHEAVLSEIQLNDYLFVITQRHRTENFFHVPTEWYLLRDSNIPIIIADEHVWKNKKTVIAAIDIKNKSTDGKLMLDKVMRTAIDFSQLVDANLQCCICIEVPEILADLDLIDPDVYAKNAINNMQSDIDALIAKFELEADNIHIKVGQPEKCIASLATKSKAKCVVIGSMARKGIAGKLIGNTAEKLTSLLHTDVLVVSPD